MLKTAGIKADDLDDEDFEEDLKGMNPGAEAIDELDAMAEDLNSSEGSEKD